MGFSHDHVFFISFLIFVSLGCGDELPFPEDDTTIKIPTLFGFGDSNIDSGNNNFLSTSFKTNYSPYGIDFDHQIPTGRTTNGLTVLDFIAQFDGLPFPPPVLGLSEDEKRKTLTGVNYASAGAGILPLPPAAVKIFGHVLSFEEQINLFKNSTLDYLKDEFNSAEDFSLYLSKSLAFMNIGTNDMGVSWNFLENPIEVHKYAKLLATELSKMLNKLYQLGLRKFIVNNVSPLGCIPDSRNTTKPNTPCNEDINTRISTFNKLLPPLLSDLESSFPGSKFILLDVYQLLQQVFASPASYGFNNVKDSCCVKGKEGDCLQGSKPCNDREKHVYFDSYHFSEGIHSLWARKFLNEFINGL